MTLTALAATRVLVALPPDEAGRLPVVCEILAQEGADVVALAPADLPHLDELTSQMGGRIVFGVHGLDDPAGFEAAKDAGAAFACSTFAAPDLALAAEACGLPYFAGGFTPTELRTAWSYGPTGLLVHPADVLGTQYATHARGSVPTAPLIASSVGTYAAGRWYAAGAVAVIPDADLTANVLKDADLGSFREKVRSYITEARQASRWQA